MKLKSLFAKPFASYIYKQVRKGMATAVEDQELIFKELLKVGSKTLFGIDHHLKDVRTYEDFKAAVKIRDYENYKSFRCC